jgi:hypothetical protein
LRERNRLAAEAGIFCKIQREKFFFTHAKQSIVYRQTIES